MPRKSIGKYSAYDSNKGEFDPNSLTGLWPDFGKEIQRVCRVGTDYEMSSREIARRTRVNNVTISKMMTGDKVEFGTVVRFAQAMGADINKLLSLCNYLPFQLTEHDISESQGLLPKGYKAIYAPHGEDALTAEFRAGMEMIVKGFPESIQTQVREKYYKDALDYIRFKASQETAPAATLVS